MQDLTGTRLGQFEIIGKIGEGGMGAVFKARDTMLSRVVALKVLPPELALNAELMQRFRQEASTAASLEHPNIVTIYNIGEQDGLHFIAMRYLKGQTLKEIIRRERTLAPPRVAQILAQLADALDYAHQRGFVHRDVKPTNIIIGAADQVTLTDFGIARALAGARLTRRGVSLGTPKYMAPEQCLGRDTSPQSDIYALGIVVYEMLTGRVPFSGDTPQQISQGHIQQPPQPLSQVNPAISPAVDRVVLRALAKKPADRFPSASAFAAALREALETVAYAPAPVERWKLVAPDGRAIPLSKGAISFGRQEGNTIVLEDGQVSRRHAEVRGDAREFVIVDLGSSNGTFVNDRRVMPHTPHPLRPGDRVMLGRNVRFTVHRGVISPPAPGGALTVMPADLGAPISSPTKARRGSPWLWGIITTSVVLTLGLIGLLILPRDNSDSSTKTATSRKLSPTTVAIMPTRLSATPAPIDTVAFAQSTVLPTPTDMPSDFPTRPATLPPTSTPLGLVYHEDFADDAHWHRGAGTTQDEDRFFADNEYHILVKTAPRLVWDYNTRARLADFSATIEARVVRSPADYEYGMVFRLVDEDNFLCFMVRKDGAVQAAEQKNGRWRVIQDWRANSAVRAAPATNQFEVIGSEEYLAVYANRQHLITFATGNQRAGYIGVVVGAFEQRPNVEVAFRNLEVRKLLQKPSFPLPAATPTRRPAAAPTATVTGAAQSGIIIKNWLGADPVMFGGSGKTEDGAAFTIAEQPVPPESEITLDLPPGHYDWYANTGSHQCEHCSCAGAFDVVYGQARRIQFLIDEHKALQGAVE